VSRFSEYTVEAWQQEVAELESAVGNADRELDRLRAELTTQLEARKQCAARAHDLRGLLRGVSSELAEKYPEPQDGTGEPDPRRDGLIDGLRGVADYLETHPQIPTPYTSVPIDITIHARLYSEGAHAAAKAEAETDRIAALMGVTACRETPNSHYRATLPFGKYVHLEAVSTRGSRLDWKPGDPMPSGVPADVIAKYEAKYPPAGHDAATCPDCTGQDTAEDDVPVGQCGKRAVDLDGATGRCIRDAGHEDPMLEGYDGTMSEHFDPAFGVWDDGHVNARLKLVAGADGSVA